MGRYLVTGGAGFIGSHVCAKLLAQGHELRVVDDLSTGKREHLDRRVEFFHRSITREGMWKTLLDGVDGVFHLAAIASVERSRLEWAATHAVNLSATVGLFAAIAARQVKIPVVYASSAAIYGPNPHLPLKESEAPAPATAYGADKLGCEQHAQVASHVHGIPTLGLRFFNVYGPRQDPASPYSGVISIFMDRIPRGLPITLHGDGLQTRDFVYVGDVVNALQAAMQALQEGKTMQGVCNVCTGKATGLKELIAVIESLSGKKAQISVAPARAGDIKASQGDAAQLATLLGVHANTPLEHGLRAMMEDNTQ